MINAPVQIRASGFQMAWVEAVKLLLKHNWSLRNLVVYIQDPTEFDNDLGDAVNRFAALTGLLAPEDVAQTIFPHRLYRKHPDASELFDTYNRSHGIYDRIKHGKHWWGTYFRRITHYEVGKKKENQLDRIIQAIVTRSQTHKAAYTILIQHPGAETVRPQGGPCLNYVALQLEPGPPFQLGLLAVYRNHDFLKRAYGNYWGLANLLRFLATEVNAEPASLTCISSRAFVDSSRNALRRLVVSL